MKTPLAAGLSNDDKGLASGGAGATAYAEAVSVYLAFVIDKMADLGNSTLRDGNPLLNARRQLFGREVYSDDLGFCRGESTWRFFRVLGSPH